MAYVWLVIFTMIMLGINIYSYRDYIKSIRTTDNENLNGKLDQISMYKDVIGEKRTNLVLASSATLITIFYSIYYMSISGIFHDNKFLLIGGIIIILYTVTHGIISALRIAKNVRLTDKKDFLDYVKFGMRPATTIYLIVSLWEIFSVIHQ